MIHSVHRYVLKPQTISNLASHSKLQLTEKYKMFVYIWANFYRLKDFKAKHALKIFPRIQQTSEVYIYFRSKFLSVCCLWGCLCFCIAVFGFFFYLPVFLFFRIHKLIFIYKALFYGNLVIVFRSCIYTLQSKYFRVLMNKKVKGLPHLKGKTTLHASSTRTPCRAASD